MTRHSQRWKKNIFTRHQHSQLQSRSLRNSSKSGCIAYVGVPVPPFLDFDSDDPPCPSPQTLKVSPNTVAHDDEPNQTAHGLDDMDARAAVDAEAAKLSTPPDAPMPKPDGPNSATPGAPNGFRSSPPVLLQDVTMETDLQKAVLEDNRDKSDSEAETIVLPGKDGFSPSKVRARKSIKHEDKSEDEDMRDAPDLPKTSGGAIMVPAPVPSPIPTLEPPQSKGGEISEAPMTSSLGKRKRPKHGNLNGVDDPTHPNSSGLSSVPTSPVATNRSSLSKPAASDSEISRSPSPRSRSRSSIRDKAKSVDRVLLQRKRHASGSGDDEEIESRRLGRQRSSGVDRKANRGERDGPLSSKSNTREISPRKRTRSTSPRPKPHRRSLSTQLPTKTSHGLSHKKRRVPAPLQSTEYHSDDSSASGSSHPRSSRLRHLAAQTSGDATISPAKMAPHKKHVNSSGQTLLAIACSRGKLENVKQRYEERPDDLNLPDNAENTPLHIASLSGYTAVVKFLLETGKCKLDEVNLERDTPLHDAVDNKNVDVVKLLLDAGANPNKPNKAGNDPLDLLNAFDDPDDEAEQQEVAEMRAAIMAARSRFTADVHQKSEEFSELEDNENRLSRPSKGSPRPSLSTHHTHDLDTFTGTKKSGTARSMVKTKDRALYQHLDIPTMRNAARDGDIQTISRILEVYSRQKLNDEQTLYNAARGGHDSIVNLLFALGDFNPDPPVLEGVPADHATPMLAAIGKDNHFAIVELILGQSKFDPTRRIKGETYYEIAKRRAGPRWQEEVKVLKKAFDDYQAVHKNSPKKSRSPVLRRDGREPEHEPRKQGRREEQPASQTHKQSTSSPKSREIESTKSQHKPNSSSNKSKEGHNILKRGPGRPRKDESLNLVALSDREPSPLRPPKQKSMNRKAEPDVANISESEPAVKPRRKLVSGKEFRGERELERQRRASVASNVSGASVKDKRERGSSDIKSDKLDGKSSPNVPRVSKGSNSSHNDRDVGQDKHSSEKDRARSLKRDDSKDRLSAIRGESPVKRPRKSETPPRSNMQEMTAAYSTSGAPQKRRKIEVEKTESTPSSSPEHRNSITKSTHPREKNPAKSEIEGKDKISHRAGQKHGEATESKKDPIDSDKVSPKRSAKAGNSNSTSTSEPSAKKSKHSAERPPHRESAESNLAPTKTEEAEAQRAAQLKRERKALEAARQKEIEEEKERKALEAARQKEIEEEKEREKEKARIEQARQERLAREEAARMEELKRQKDEAERKERQLREDREAHERAEKEKRALYEEQERLKREEKQRRQALKAEAERLERARIEKEKEEERLAKLPLLLRWFDLVNEPKVPEIAKLFKRIEGFRYDTINPEASGQAIGREQWMLNTQAAILLGEKDLKLSRYTAWERMPLSPPQKNAIYMLLNGQILLKDGELPSLRKQLPPNIEAPWEIFDKNRLLFVDMELFFVKTSEFMFVVPNFPHLRGVELQVFYQELRVPQTSTPLGPIMFQSKWRQDPDTPPNENFEPLPRYFINGQFIRQEATPMTVMTKEPPPEDRFPRREGITRVFENEPDYEEVCMKQGLHHLIPGFHSSPVSVVNPQLGDLSHQSELMNGITPPRSDKSRSVNGGSPQRGSISELQASPQLPNGVLNLDESAEDALG